MSFVTKPWYFVITLWFPFSGKFGRGWGFPRWSCVTCTSGGWYTLQNIINIPNITYFKISQRKKIFVANDIPSLNICRYCGWIELNSICQFNQYIYKYWDGDADHILQGEKSVPNGGDQALRLTVQGARRPGPSFNILVWTTHVCCPNNIWWHISFQESSFAELFSIACRWYSP